MINSLIKNYLIFLVEHMITVLKKIERRTLRVNAELDPRGSRKDLFGKGLGFYSCGFGTKYLPL